MATNAERAGFAFIILLYLALSFLVFDQIEEDAFIYFRLLGNLVHGDGFVFNRGGEPIEAGSSPLWMLLLLLFWKAPWDIVITAKLLGIAAGCVCLWLVWRIARHHFADPLLRLGAPLLTVGSTPFLMWSQRGLETPLFTLIVLWLCLCCTDVKRFRCWGLPGCLLLLARPEGFLYLLGILPELGCNRAHWRGARRSILIIAGVAVGLLAVRLMYFHDLAPSPFYVKFHGGRGQSLNRIREYVHHSQLFIFLVPLAVVGWRRRFWSRERSVLAVNILIAVTWNVLANDYTPYVRHLVPAIPLLCILLIGAADALAGARRRTLVFAYIAGMFVLTLFFSRSSLDFGASGENSVRADLRAFAANPDTFTRALLAKLSSPAEANMLDEISGRTDTLNNFQTQVGYFLRRNYPADTVVVYDQMGQTPYYAGWSMRFIDTFGLTNRTMGRAYFERWKRDDAFLRLYSGVASRTAELAFGERRGAFTEADALDYVFGLKADLILLNTVVIKADPAGIPALLMQDPRLRRDYARRYVLALMILVYERKDTHHPHELHIPPGLSVISQSD